MPWCRTDREKESSGVPDVPNSGRVVELEYASISDRKIRGQLRNPSEIEKTVSLRFDMCTRSHYSLLQ